MRVSAVIIATVSANRVARQAPGEEKRYSQLVDMMAHYNADFDERKYWAYGCNCLILGKLAIQFKNTVEFRLRAQSNENLYSQILDTIVSLVEI